MNVISGKLKGKKLFYIQKSTVRPMTQKVREAIFDILRERIVNVTMLDLFCGSGAVGIEGLSRGVAHVDFIDLDVGAVVKNINSLGLNGSVNIYRKDTLRALHIMNKKNKRYDFIFIGAPYDYSNTAQLLTRIDEYEILKVDGFIMLEHHKREPIPSGFKNFEEKKCYTYGQTVINLYESKL